MLFIISLNMEDVVNYYKNLESFYSQMRILFYKSQKSKLHYIVSGTYYETKDYTSYTGYLNNGSKFLIEYKNDSTYLYLNDNLKSVQFQEYPAISPYKMFVYLYIHNFEYTIREKDNIFEIVFYTQGKPFIFTINSQYKILRYNPPFNLIIEFNN
jgi:hypothetical protein